MTRHPIRAAIRRAAIRSAAIRRAPRMAASLLAAASAACWLSPAQAEILAAANRTTPAIYGGASYSVSWSDGSTSLSFTTSAPNTRVAVLFNAECAVDGPTTRWLDIDLIVDPAGPTGEQVIAPTNSDNALCSGNGNNVGNSGSFNLDGWVSASALGYVTLPQAGTHTVRVRVNGANAGVARLDDMALIVMR